MSDISEESVNVARDAFISYALRHNAIMKFREFSEIVSKKNNQKIEETELIKKLKQLLSESIYEQDTPPAIDLPASDTPFFRARIINDIFDSEDKGLKFSHSDIISGYNKFESKEPAIGISGHGRNSYIGSSYLYFADNRYTACAEVRPYPYSFISLATFKILNRLRIVDFSKCYHYSEENEYAIDVLMSLISSMFSKRVNDSEEYYATQYIADLIRKYGFDGICYRSSVSEGVNYTIFNCNENNVGFISSEVIMVDEIHYNFYSFNSLKKYDTIHENNEEMNDRLKIERSKILKEAIRREQNIKILDNN